MSPKACLLLLFCLGISLPARADLPTGYLVWTKGEAFQPASRRIYRMTLPEKTDIRALTSGSTGADIEGQISPDGQWVAFAKSKLPDATYHMTKMWKIYIVSIHGIGEGREEYKIDDNGYWPSWGADGTLYYSQVDDDGSGSEHTRVIRVTLDEYGGILEKVVFFSTREAFPDFIDMNECFVAPQADWMAARTRGEESQSGVGAVSLFPPRFQLLAKAGSVGCMPVIAPGGLWGLIAGRDEGIRWGDAPEVAERRQDELLIPSFGDGDLCYHPGISSDEEWVLASHGSENDHDAGPYDLYIYKLDTANKTVDSGQLLAGGGFNGWPHVWVGEPGDPPPPRPHVDSFMPGRWTLTPGESVELTWQTSFADQVSLDAQAVEPDGTASHQLQESHRFQLVASSSQVEESHEVSIQITVNPSAQPVAIESFELEPASIQVGESATLSWVVRNPYTIQLNGEPLAPEGSMEVSPVADSEYVLEATGDQGPVSESLLLEVEELKQGLEDRGGCFCGDASYNEMALALLLMLGLLFRHRRSRA